MSSESLILLQHMDFSAFSVLHFGRSLVDCNQFRNGQQKTFRNSILYAIKRNIVFDSYFQILFYDISIHLNLAPVNTWIFSQKHVVWKWMIKKNEKDREGEIKIWQEWQAIKVHTHTHAHIHICIAHTHSNFQCFIAEGRFKSNLINHFIWCNFIFVCTGIVCIYYYWCRNST